MQSAFATGGQWDTLSDFLGEAGAIYGRYEAAKEAEKERRREEKRAALQPQFRGDIIEETAEDRARREYLRGTVRGAPPLAGDPGPFVDATLGMNGGGNLLLLIGLGLLLMGGLSD